ncbi:sporulation protein YunB [Paenibacillus sp. HN-1]|nr:sporulation protein YunB [Paenibacillus sp. CGMCC 1.18879]MBY9082885.1 sporulation protein YunB [Paenibacillus sinensis]
MRRWGPRRLHTPQFRLPRLRLPRISWTPPARQRAFRSAGPWRPAAGSRGSRSSGFPGGGGLKQGARFKARPGRSARPALGFGRRQGSGGGPGLAPADGSRRRPRSRRRAWLISALLFLAVVLASVGYVERQMKPPIVHLAQIRVKQIATEAINKAISSQVAGGSSAEKLIDWKTDSAGKISGFMLNYNEHMRITSEAADVIQSTLSELQTRKEHIPLGQALDSPLIASFGPDIPVKIEPQGAVKVELSTRQQNAGINMILVEVYIHIVTELAVVVPFDMEPQVVDTEIPVSYLMVVGDVPMYYYDNQGRAVGEGSASAPNIALPAPSSGGVSSGAAGTGQSGAAAGDGGTGSGVSTGSSGSGTAAGGGAGTGSGASGGGTTKPGAPAGTGGE